MTHIEFVNEGLHNRHIEFSYKGQTLTGVVIDYVTVLYPKEQKHTNYLFIPSNNLIAWREAETKEDKAKMKELTLVVDIDKIEWGHQLPMTQDEVNKRIIDWKNRLKELYDFLELCLKDKKEFSIKRTADKQMYESLMQSFGVQQQTLITADIYKNRTLIMSFKPVGLWLIGANGKIDILSNKGNFILVDLSSNYRTPDWQIYLTNKRTDRVKLSKSVFLKLLEL